MTVKEIATAMMREHPRKLAGIAMDIQIDTEISVYRLASPEVECVGQSAGFTVDFSYWEWPGREGDAISAALLESRKI